ncbi:MAG: fatty acid desaturase [Ilumatobacter sp.]|uniref:fatty acid desaturase n=1 Tax=Ilumatobacter sp. TaxID=1967498 RepID=UPI003918888E
MATTDVISSPTPGVLVPMGDALTDVLPTERFNDRGVPTRPWRDELRRIADLRNLVTVVGCVVQSFGVVIVAAVIHTWWSYALAFVLMARGHVCLNILAHEAAHRLLFSKRWANDHVGRWVLGYPTLQPTLAYRRAHFAHHRDEMGPDEPDMNLYSGYPIPADSWHRKLRRDLTGVTGYKRMKQLGGALRNGGTEAWQVVGVQIAMLALSIAFARPLAYVVWIVSWLTIWQFTNRLRAIAEHGGMIRSRDRRQTTHVVRQTWLARYWIVPYHTGWHLAHHVDMGVTWRNLPRLHEALVADGWITPEITYPSYRDFWRHVTR